MKRPLVVAHRGDVQNAPENTLPAFQSAIAGGADILEFDVHQTRDGQLVVHHDYYLGRTDNGLGYIGDYTLAELKQLDAGGWFGTGYAGLRMPTLGEVLDLGRGKVFFEVQICSSSLTCLRDIRGEIARFGAVDDVELTSEHVPLLVRAREMNAKLRTGLFFQAYPEWMQPPLGQQRIIDWLTAAGAQVAHVPLPLLESGFVTRLQAAGFLVHGADLNVEDEIKRAVSVGLDQFSTDHLSLAMRALNKLFE